MDLKLKTNRRVRIAPVEENRWVVKIGSALLTDNGRGLDRDAISRWVNQISALQQQGMDIVLVSSGAIAEGLSRLGWSSRPIEIPRLQAAAAVGQMGLMQVYETSFNHNGIRSAQILLTHDDFANRQRYLNIEATLRALIQLRAVPIINENDTVSTEEICFGDNDMLAALVANMVAADRLIILTDQQGLYTKDPRLSQDVELISAVSVDDERLLAMAGGSSKWGRGGMASKVKAARMFALSGGVTTIASGRTENVLERIRSGQAIGTALLPGEKRLLKRKQWLAGHLKTRGILFLDAGAAQAVAMCGGSILPVGVTAIHGNFGPSEMIQIQDIEGRYVARGLSNYSAREMSQIISSSVSMKNFGVRPTGVKELVHRRNIVLDPYQ
ncbi:glutamate 5-kinase [Collimonas silvisoli]|uniref:glutamate 5-kinase n=1 Tax=Collimonas silvisoli TaxID=2825884 RepID=UPI001B8CD8A3|nr:glutamate 5-kinase [Collimonas silvisoli]